MEEQRVNGTPIDDALKSMTHRFVVTCSIIIIINFYMHEVMKEKGQCCIYNNLTICIRNVRVLSRNISITSDFGIKQMWL